MFQRTYDFSVDFMTTYKIAPMTFIQDDTNVNVMNITLVSNGTPIDITGCTIELRFRKSDNTVVLGMATITDAVNGKTTYNLGTNEISYPGNVLVGVMIYGQNGERASSYPFRFSVLKDMDDQYDAVSSTEYPILTSLIAETTEIRNDYLELMNGGGGTDHIHINKDVLDGLSDVNGTLEYNGQPIQGTGGTADSIAWTNVTGKPTFANVATSGSYTDLTNRPNIPTTTSQLTNDSSFVTSTQVNQMITNSSSGSTTVSFYTNIVTPSSGMASIPIGISEYAIGDMLDAWMDGLLLYPGINYSLNGGAIGLLDFTADGTNIFYFKVMKATSVAAPVDTTAPENVTNLVSSNITATGLTLTWTASSSSDVASYDVYNGVTLLGNTTSIAYNVSGLTASTQYTFSVRARDNSGNVASGTSVTTTTTAPASDTTAPNDVTNLTTSNVTQTSLTLTWTASTSSDIASYDVYNGATLLGNTASTTYNVTGLTAGTQYTFSVRARDTSNNIATGTTVTITTTATSGGETQAGTVIASDTFTRANSTTTLGTTEVGSLAWVYRGTWGITNNQAYMQTMVAYDNYACVDAGTSNCKVSVKLTNVVSWETGVAFRLQNNDTHWRVQAKIDGYHLYRQQWGTPYEEGFYACTPTNGDVISVILNADSITAQLNGVTIITKTSTVLQTNTLHGIYNNFNNNNGTIGRWDDFEIRTLS